MTAGAKSFGRPVFRTICALAGVGNVLGNKGGVGVALTYLKHTRLLFINAHFAAHDHKVAQRQADYLRIKAGLFNAREEPGLIWTKLQCTNA